MVTVSPATTAAEEVPTFKSLPVNSVRGTGVGVTPFAPKFRPVKSSPISGNLLD